MYLREVASAPAQRTGRTATGAAAVRVSSLWTRHMSYVDKIRRRYSAALPLLLLALMRV